MKNIFRKDLNLNDKWYHRLFQIVFVAWLIILLWNIFIDFLNQSNNHYKLVDKLENRLNDKAVKIWDLLEYWEKFARFGDFWWNIKEYWEYWNSDLYCSNKLYDFNNIKYIIKQTWISNFNRLSSWKNKITIDEFSNTIKNDNIKCIIKDNAQIDFLNPIDWFNEYWFYKKNNIDYFLDSFVIISLILELLTTFFIYIILVYIIYYKIILYVIYWKELKN